MQELMKKHRRWPRAAELKECAHSSHSFACQQTIKQTANLFIAGISMQMIANSESIF